MVMNLQTIVQLFSKTYQEIVNMYINDLSFNSLHV